MHEYGKLNLAHVNVMIERPYITKIRRDVAMTFTNYVANSGGLIGLCIGFSFLSGIEIIFWLCNCCYKFKNKVWSESIEETAAKYEADKMTSSTQTSDSFIKFLDEERGTKKTKASIQNTSRSNSAKLVEIEVNNIYV